MGYADRFYFGQGKLIVKTSASSVDINDGISSKTVAVSGGVASALLPPTKSYTVTANDKVQDIYVSYGDCIEIEL